MSFSSFLRGLLGMCCELASACHRGSCSPSGLFSRSVNKVCCCKGGGGGEGDSQSHQRSRLRTSKHAADGRDEGGGGWRWDKVEGRRRMLGISEVTEIDSRSIKKR